MPTTTARVSDLGSDYPRTMAVTAHDIAHELRRRLPGVSAEKVHQLLYYCHGHHLAATGEPLFLDPVMASDTGPTVGVLSTDDDNRSSAQLSEAQLNSIGYVASRYGGLTGADLQRLMRTEGPTRRAEAGRGPGQRVRIEDDWMREWFEQDAEEQADALGPLDRNEVRAWLSGTVDRRGADATPDDIDEIRRRLTRAG